MTPAIFASVYISYDQRHIAIKNTIPAIANEPKWF